MNARIFGLSVLALIAALALAACGDSDTSDSADTAEETTTSADSSDWPQPELTGIAAQEGEARDHAYASAEKAAGEPTEIPDITLGYLQIVGGIEAADRHANATKKAAETLGWDLIYCDGQGVPQQMVTCANSLLSQGVDAIVGNGIDASVLADPIRKAKKQNVPIVMTTENPGYSGSYTASEQQQGQTLVDYIIEEFGDSDEKQEIAVHKYASSWGEAREVPLLEALKDHPNIEIAATTTSDPADLINGTKKAVSSQLTANPDLAAFWFTFDTAGQAGAQQIQQMAQGEDAPEVLTFHADPSTQELIESGVIKAVSDVDYDAGDWIAIDQLAQYFARDTPLSQDMQPTYPGMGDMYDYQIITKENLPDTQYVEPEVDVVSFFEKKWELEFGI